MHTMKNISKYLGVALLLFGAACSKTQEGTYYNPNKDDSKEIHFIQSSIEKEFAQAAQSGTIDVQKLWHKMQSRGGFFRFVSIKPLTERIDAFDEFLHRRPGGANTADKP